ncbi:malate transporter [Deltaproteobacteria bacterium Smac51]|nr:malate transporter [Deltaproteobacteria bacterium Smac51]
MFAVIQQAVECVLSLFLIGLVGYVLDKRGWFGEDTKIMLPRLVTLITLPPYLFSNVVGTFNHDDLIHLVYGAAVPAASITLTFLAGSLMSKFMKKPEGRSGLFRTGIVASNTIFIGIPINIALFGEEALPYVLLYFFANTTFFWTIGNYLLSLDGGNTVKEGVFSRASLKRIFSPPLMGFAVGLLFIMLGLRVPDFIMDAAGYIGGLTTPLAIIFIGITLAGVNFRQIRLDRDVLMLIFGRFIISPATIILLMRFVELPPLMAKVFIIQASLPVVSSAVLMAGYYRSDKEYASVVVSLTTLMSLITIPLAMVVISLMP